MWPCCHRAIFRIDGSTGAKIWQKDWGPAFSVSAQGDTVQSVDTDGTLIFAGGGRASLSGSAADVFNVRGLDSDGNLVWETDVGGQVREVQFISGVGLLVSHDVSHDVADAVLLQNTGAAASFIINDSLGSTSALASGSSAATVQAAIEGANAFLSGNVSVSGASMVAGFSVQFDSSLGSNYTGRRPMVMAAKSPGPSPDFSMQSASMANVTCLDESDGSVLWSAFVGQIQPPTGSSSIPGAGSVRSFNGNLYVGTHSSAVLAPAVGLTKLDTSGALVGTVNTGTGSSNGAAMKTLATDGSYLYIADYEPGNGMQKLDTADAAVWAAPIARGVPKLVIDGSDVWVCSSAGGAGAIPVKRQASDGAQIASITGEGPYQDMCVLPSSEYAVAGGGTSRGVRKFDSSYTEAWTFTDTNFGRCCCAYGSDVIMGMQRV